MPNESLVDEILTTAAGRKKGGQSCYVCSRLNPVQLKAIREAHERGASYGAIHEHIEKKWKLTQVTFHSVRGHLASRHCE